MAENSAYVDLLDKIDKQIERFNGKRRSHEDKYTTLAIIQIITGVAATLVLGWAVSPENAQTAKNFALVLTSATTICTLLLSHFQFKDHYVAFTWVVSQLRQLKSELEFRQKLSIEKPTVGLDEKVLVDMHNKFSAILSESNSGWKSRMNQAVAATSNSKKE